MESKSIAPLTESIVGRGIVGVTTGRSRVPVAGHREEDGGDVVVGGGTEGNVGRGNGGGIDQGIGEAINGCNGEEIDGVFLDRLPCNEKSGMEGDSRGGLRRFLSLASGFLNSQGAGGVVLVVARECC